MTLPEANAGGSILWQFLGRRLPQSSILALFTAAGLSFKRAVWTRQILFALQFLRIPVLFRVLCWKRVSDCRCEVTRPSVVRITNDC